MNDESSPYTVEQHFAGCAPEVRTVYARILEAAQELGPVREEPKKTSIHLARKTAFAGVATRKQALILTFKSATDLPSARIARREQASAHRWHLEIRLDDPAQVDGELTKWLADAFELAG